MPTTTFFSHLLAILIIQFLSLLISIHSLTSTCSEDKFSLMKEGKNITKCMELETLGAKFGWNYYTNPANQTIIDIVFSARPPTGDNGWVAWGINHGSRPRMVDTSALIAFKQPNGRFRVDLYNITTRTKLGCPLEPSEIDVEVKNPLAIYKEQTFLMYATLILPNNSHYNISKLKHVWQVGSSIVGSVPMMHAKALENFDSVGTVNLTSGKCRGPAHHRRHLRTVHATLSVIGWGILLPTGVIIVRYFREFPFKYSGWFVLHVSCQLSAFLIGTIAWGIGLSVGNSSKDYTFKSHRILGILIFTFSALQMLAFWLKPKRADKFRKYWDIYHHFLGYGLITAIVFNIFKGFSILQPNKKWKSAYVGILLILGCVALVLEITTWVKWGNQRNSKNSTNPANSPQPQHKSPLCPPTSKWCSYCFRSGRNVGQTRSGT